MFKRDRELSGKKAKFTSVIAPYLSWSNFNLRVEEELKNRLTTILDTNSELLLSGELDYLESTSEDNSGFKVIQITIKVQNMRRVVLAKLSCEINDTIDIARILQLTIAPSYTHNFEEPNQEVAKAEKAPAFALAANDKSQVVAINFPTYSMGLRRRENGQGPAIPVEPADQNGFAYAALGHGDTFEIVLYNYDERSEAVAKIEIEGLDVTNTFSSDKTASGEKQSYLGYSIPRAVDGKPGE